MAIFTSITGGPTNSKPIQIVPNVDDLQSRLLHILNRPDLRESKNAPLRNVLENKARLLSTCLGTNVLSIEDVDFYVKTRSLIDITNRISSVVAQQLITSMESSPAPSSHTKRPLPQSETPNKHQKTDRVQVLPPLTPLALFNQHRRVDFFPQTSMQAPPPPSPVTKTSIIPAAPVAPSFAFGCSEYETYLGKVAQTLPNNAQKIIELMQQPCPFHPGKQIYQTHILRWIVPEIDGKSYTLRGQTSFFTHSKLGDRKTQCSLIDKTLLDKYGDQSVPAPRWILVTCELIPGSEGKSREDQLKLLATYPSYRLGTALELTTSLLTHYVYCKERLYEKTYTRTQESGFAVGGYTKSGLYVGEYDDNKAQEKVGIAAVRELPDLK